MNSLLIEPDSVLVIGTAGTEEIEETILAGEAVGVEVVESIDAAEIVLSEREDVACVVATDSVADGSVIECCEIDAGYWTDIPIVCWVTDGSSRLAAEVSEAGADRYVPASIGDGILKTAVDEAIETYRARREQAADSSAFQTLLQESHRTFYVKDRDVRTLRLSYVPESVDPDHAFGKTDAEIYGGVTEEASEMIADDRRIIETEEPIRGKEERTDYPDLTVWTETTKVPWYGPDGELVGLVGTSYDISDRYRYQLELERRQKELETYTSYISHDLRTPLQVASGQLEMARRTGDETALQKVDDALDRIEEMIDEFSDLANKRATSALDDADTEEIDIHDPIHLRSIIRSIWQLVKPEAATLELQLPEAAILFGNETDLRPIFENLFKNALEHGSTSPDSQTRQDAIDHGGDDVTVTIGATTDGAIFVEDDGPGIPPDERDRIFDRGYTTSDEGTGTGLSIVDAAARQANWSIEVTEGKDGGARFEIHDCLLVTEPNREFAVGTAAELDQFTGVRSPETDGHVERDGDTLTMEGGGLDIYGIENQFHFAYTTIESPVRLTANVGAPEQTHEFAKAGLMVRSGLDPEGTYGGLSKIPSGQTEILCRGQRGDHGNSVVLGTGEETFDWYRIDSLGDTVRFSLSTDGEEWLPIDDRRVDLDDSVAVGLFVCSHRDTVTTSATFENVSLVELEPRDDRNRLRATGERDR